MEISVSPKPIVVAWRLISEAEKLQDTSRKLQACVRELHPDSVYGRSKVLTALQAVMLLQSLLSDQDRTHGARLGVYDAFNVAKIRSLLGFLLILYLSDTRLY